MKITQCIRIGLRHPDDFRTPAIVSPFVTELAAQGFILRDLWRDESREFYSLWWGSLYDPSAADARGLSEQQKEELFTPRVSPVLEAALERLFTGDFDLAHDRLSIDIYSTAREGEMKGLTFSFTLYAPADDEEGSVAQIAFASATSNYLNTDEKRIFWKHHLPRLIYRMWQPLLVYITSEDEAPLSQKEVQQLRFRYLYDYNLYAPEVVARFGREKLLATPDATVEPLEDGGILLQPQKKATAAAYLGLEVAPA